MGVPSPACIGQLFALGARREASMEGVERIKNIFSVYTDRRPWFMPAADGEMRVLHKSKKCIQI